MCKKQNVCQVEFCNLDLDKIKLQKKIEKIIGSNNKKMDRKIFANVDQQADMGI